MSAARPVSSGMMASATANNAETSQGTETLMPQDLHGTLRAEPSDNFAIADKQGPLQTGQLRVRTLWCLTLELSGRCRVSHDSSAARRSGPLERIVSTQRH